MVWGTPRTGVDDLLQRLKEPKTGKNLCVLSFRKLSTNDIVKLANAIAQNTILEELYLSGHKLEMDGLKAFSDCLAVNKTIKHLSIGDDTLGDEGVRVLSEGLMRNMQSALEVWDLEHKSIRVNGATALGKLLATNTCLQTVNLSGNDIRDEGLKCLVTGLMSNQNSSVRMLSLIDTGISGDTLHDLADVLMQPHCQLETIQLSFNALTQASTTFFKAFPRNASVKKLYLKDCKLNDDHVSALASALQENHTLEEIDLSDNALTVQSCESLAMALKANPTLQSLNLSNNHFGDNGACILGASLTDSSTLRFLDMSKNALTHVSISKLVAIPIHHLCLFNNSLGNDVITVLPVLVANTTIETLDIGANGLHGASSVALFNSLHTHPSLKTLEMGGNSLGQVGHDALEKLRTANPLLDVAVDKNAQDEEGGFQHQ